MSDLELSPRGTLWTFTTQDFALKEPYQGAADEEPFEPFGLGYVELPEHVKVETLLTEHDPEKSPHRHGDGARHRPRVPRP